MTDDPLTSENGVARSTDAGIVHAVFDLTVALLRPSQFDVSDDHELSAC